MVLIFFPFLYEDEILYSILARYHQYSGNENSKTSVYEILGSDTACASTTLPANLQLFCNRLPLFSDYTPNYFIDSHTLLPYYAPFIPKERYLELRMRMSNNNGSSLYMKLGKVASNIKSNNYLNYCKECVTEEIRTNGEVYWHRTHQVEGVKVCPNHKTWLLETNVPFSERKNKHEFIPLESSINIAESVNHKIGSTGYDHYIYIADQTNYLLNNKIEPLGLNNLQKYYVARLQEKGLTSVGGRIRWKELISTFNYFYGKEFLQNVNCYVELDKEDTWIHKVLRKPRVSCHPLRHILLLGLLGESISSLVCNIDSTTYAPFGKGPWYCLNKAADHYMKPILHSCVITKDYKTGHPIGTFSCSCGFVYARKGPDSTDKDQYKIGRIKEFGSVWESKLTNLMKKNLSLRKMGEILGVDPMTIRNKLSVKKGKTNKVLKSKKYSYRKQWNYLIESNKEKSLTQIRSIDSKLYMWLYRNDNKWLKVNSPSTNKIKNYKNNRVNWQERDSYVAKAVEKIAKSILNKTEVLIRVTKNEIGRELGKLGIISLATLYRKLDKMPKTKKILQEYIESVDQFQIRRIKSSAESIKETKSFINEWELIRAAGLKKQDAQKHYKIIKEQLMKI
jgi:hypothetical protein